MILDSTGAHVFVAGKEVRLNKRERAVLVHIVEQGGRVCRSGEILEAVWGDGPDATSRALHTTIKRLRDKLGPAGVLLETIWAVGYRLTSRYPLAFKGRRPVPPVEGQS